MVVGSSYAPCGLAWERKDSSALEVLSVMKFSWENGEVKFLLVNGEEAAPESPRKIGIGLFNENCQETIKRNDGIQWRDGEVTAVLSGAW